MNYGDDDRIQFADPGGRSALRAATKSNPRNRPCPACGRKNVLTPLDVARSYQCDHCADAAERGAVAGGVPTSPEFKEAADRARAYWDAVLSFRSEE